MVDQQPRKVGRKPSPKRRTDADGRVTVAGKAGNGAGSVYFSSQAGRWEAKAHHPVTGKRLKRTGATREQATQRMAEALASVGQSRTAPLGPTPTVAALLGYYLNHVAAPRVAPTTLTTYRKQAATIIRYAGSLAVSDLGKADAQTLVSDLHRDHSHHYASGCKRLAKRALGEAIDLGYLASNPIDRVQSPQRPEIAYRTLTLDQQRALVTEALTGRYRHGVAVAVLFSMGLRVSEVLGLRWEDIDYESERVTIQRAVTYLDGHGPVVQQPKTKATKGARHLPDFLHEPLRRLRVSQVEERLALGPYLDASGDGFVFVGTRHQLVNRQAVTKEVRRVCQAIGIDADGVATHTGRRTVITNLYRDGAVTEDIAAAVGHADPSTTRGYVQDLGDRPTATSRRMAKLIAPGRG